MPTLIEFQLTFFESIAILTRRRTWPQKTPFAWRRPFRTRSTAGLRNTALNKQNSEIVAQIFKFLEMSRERGFYLWQDREIKFDIDKYDLAERPGERLLAYFDPVEDTKVGCPRKVHIFCCSSQVSLEARTVIWVVKTVVTTRTSRGHPNKGNNGQRGFLRITNLRIIWEAHKAYRVNLSIGFKAVLNMNQKSVRSKLRGNIEALHVLAQGASSRFEARGFLIL